MLYESNYRGQVYWDSPDRITLRDVLEKLNERIQYHHYVTTPPASPDLKTVGIGMLINTLVCIAVGFIKYFLHGSGIAGFVTGFVLWFAGFAVIGLIVGYNRMIKRPKKMTVEVNALVAGHSLEASNGHLLRTPVFKYEYGGRKYFAYDGVYSNTGKVPKVGEEVTIRIDPDEPSELSWSDKNNRSTFMFIGFVCAIIGSAFAYVAIYSLLNSSFMS